MTARRYRTIKQLPRNVSRSLKIQTGYIFGELHEQVSSPSGKSGFLVTTYHSNTAINHGWADSWEEYFTNTTKVLFVIGQAAQGPNEEIRLLTEPSFAKVDRGSYGR